MPCSRHPPAVSSTTPAPGSARSTTVPPIRLSPARVAPKLDRGADNTAAVAPSSTIRPRSSTITRSASTAASMTSWVTSTLVVPDSDRWVRSTWRISGTVWASSAPSGSSSSNRSGSAASARASATRWRWPPDSSAGRRAVKADNPMRSSHSPARARPAIRPRPWDRGPKATFSSAVRCGKSNGSWPIRPIRRRSGGTMVPASASVTVRPASSTRPESGISRPAMTASTVDLPAPFGPSRAIELPASTRNCASTVNSRRARVRATVRSAIGPLTAGRPSARAGSAPGSPRTPAPAATTTRWPNPGRGHRR